MNNGRVKDFLDFLIYIGLVSNKTLNIFNKNYNQITQNPNLTEKKQKKKENIYQTLTKVLNNYFTSLSNLEIKLISENITNKYKDNKLKIIKTLLKNILLNKIQKIKYLYLVKWVNQINKIKNEEFKLILIKETIKTEQNVKAEEEKHLSRFEKIQNDLINRQNKHLEKFKKNKMEQMIKNEKKNNELCPFSPTIYTKNSKTQISERNPYKRLYDDVIKRQNKILQKEKEENEKIKQNSLWKSKNKFYSKSKNNLEQTINKLYNDHKNYQSKKRLMKNNFDKENGFTFHPDISLNSKYSFSMKDCRNKSQEKKNYISLWKETK